jgi:hypothetical protein
VPNEDEVIAGWESRAGIAYCPKTESVEKLPHDLYDEWYVFKSPQDLGNLFQGNVFETSMQAGQVAAFVNFGGFSLHSPEMKALADLFWMQLELIQPESFIADGSLLNFVTCDLPPSLPHSDDFAGGLSGVPATLLTPGKAYP